MQKVVAILGGSLSSNGLAEQATARQLKIPVVCSNAARLLGVVQPELTTAE